MRLNNLVINNFRIIDKVVIRPNILNLIIGDNGQGKTSVLEAISLISGRSFKKTHDRDLVKFNKNYYLIQADISFNTSSILEIFYEINGRKVFKLDEKKVNLGYLLMSFPIIDFSLKDIEFMYESRVRRLFFDKMISYIDKVYYNNLLKLVKALKNKNKLLKERKDTSFWDMVIAEASSIIKKKRIAVIKSFNDFLVSYKEYFPDSIDNISFVYESSIDGIEKEEILRSLEINKKKDMDRGFSSGINFDTYNIMINSKNFKDFASFGQSKLIIIILHLLQALFIYNSIKIKPILLLDDFFSDIDSNNRAKIIKIVKNIGFQTFMTSTIEDSSNIKTDDISIFKIKGGDIIEAKNF